MSDARQIERARRPYSKPAYTRKSVVEVAALLREELRRPRAIDKLGQSRALIQGPILLVQDYKGDISLVRQALESAGLCVRPNSFENRYESIEIGFSEAPSDRSSLVLLDCRQPGQRNRKLLERMSRDPKLQRAPFAVLIDSTKQAETWTQRDPIECWRLNGPLNSADLARALRSFLDLWRFSDDLVLSENGSR